MSISRTAVNASPLIVTCDPPNVYPGQSFECELPAYGVVHPALGAAVFIWTAETAGGSGLEMLGELLHAVPVDGGKRFIMRIRITAGLGRQSLTKADLAPHRDRSADGPMSSLAGKLYRHAHNKVASLSTLEADHLLQFFTKVEA